MFNLLSVEGFKSVEIGVICDKGQGLEFKSFNAKAQRTQSNRKGKIGNKEGQQTIVKVKRLF